MAAQQKRLASIDGAVANTRTIRCLATMSICLLQGAEGKVELGAVPDDLVEVTGGTGDRQPRRLCESGAAARGAKAEG